MYDDSDHDSNSSSGHGDEMTVTVDGEQYEVEEEYDINKDGHNDTAIIHTDDGGAVAFTDADGDGDADVAVELDDDGNVVGAARYDEASGDWVAVDPKTGQESGSHDGGHSTTTASHNDSSHSDGSHSTGSSSHSGGGMTVDVPDQQEDINVGPATVDANHDGKNDTVVETESDGTVIAFTDTDNDGDADVVTVIETDGDVVIGEHTGEDEWTDVETGHVDSHGNYTPDKH